MREELGALMAQAHGQMLEEVVETACFLELHTSGLPHRNCLARASRQYRWKGIAGLLFRKYKVSVDFGCNIKS